MIPVNEPLIAESALKYVSDCLKSGWVSSAGSYIQKFEQEFSKYLGTKEAITTTSGTTALHLALASLGISKGDEVIVPVLTMIAVPYAVLYTGATPVMVDVDREIFGLDPRKILEFIENQCEYQGKRKGLVNRRTGNSVRAIIAVHPYGHPCPMDEILEISQKFNLLTIEDAAEALGALYFSQKKKKTFLVGSLGDVGCFSFYANKTITTGEGGMLVTNNERIAERARRLKDLAHHPRKRFFHTEIGFNYRMTNLQAALGVAQLEEIERYIEIKRKIAATYKSFLSEIGGLSLPIEKDWAKSIYWMFTVLVEKGFGLSRDDFMEKLRERGIETRTFFIPVHRQPAFRKNEYYRGLSFPVAEELSKKGLYLPSGLALREEQIAWVCESIMEIKKDSG